MAKGSEISLDRSRSRSPQRSTRSQRRGLALVTLRTVQDVVDYLAPRSAGYSKVRREEIRKWTEQTLRHPPRNARTRTLLGVRVPTASNSDDAASARQKEKRGKVSRRDVSKISRTKN
jgi:hypothetical protein